MVILDVSVPTGFDAVASSLCGLGDGGQGQRAEVAGRKVIFYIANLVRDTTRLRFQVRPLSGPHDTDDGAGVRVLRRHGQSDRALKRPQARRGQQEPARRKV
jgi:hypothetical protein